MRKVFAAVTAIIVFWFFATLSAVLKNAIQVVLVKSDVSEAGFLLLSNIWIIVLLVGFWLAKFSWRKVAHSNLPRGGHDEN
ncbi:hypothetical protein [Hydrogenovibrio marinus]|uniref:Uncharacterized protein n=1 Tax=Hydrogenovibrio marinus TaxID=28885 RepID=A0A067A1M0_HYDMR|nr:hypothetical protein [Hydrogenovibrio marinus]KDN96516.1 hypothetical protein EI16_09660 [Hydrogenovibrio marinus]BBN60282.1 hypothetical protein HVMH_1876 [Hydrogenovibrio marinus]